MRGMFCFSERRCPMSRSKFRFNKKRKHYAYLFKDLGSYRKNLILSTKPFRVFHNKLKKIKTKKSNKQ